MHLNVAYTNIGVEYKLKKGMKLFLWEKYTKFWRLFTCLKRILEKKKLKQYVAIEQTHSLICLKF